MLHIDKKVVQKSYFGQLSTHPNKVIIEPTFSNILIII